MPLSSYSIRTSRIALGKSNDFEVRALAFPDIISAVSGHLPSLVAIVAKYQQAQQDVFSKKNTFDLALMVARDFPNIATEIISMCIVGEEVTEATRATIACLPAPVSMNALVEIVRLTVEEAGGLGNLVADFRNHAQVVMAQQGELSPILN